MYMYIVLCVCCCINITHSTYINIYQYSIIHASPHASPHTQAQRSPVTEYYFWPKKDAWEELKTALEARPWISER